MSTDNAINNDQIDRQRAKRMGVAPSSSLRRHFLSLARQTRQWAHQNDRAAIRPCTIGVTSISLGSGNSTVAYNLAVAMTSVARSRVLLVECDFGRNFITRRLGNARKLGLSELLTGMADMDEAVSTTPIRNLDAVGCGQVNEQIALELPFDELPSVINRSFIDYEYCIFDLPVASNLTACHSLVPALDGVILNVEANQIDHKLISRFRNSMQALNVPIVGMVINKQ
ncbi:AAA family ATPase [Mariniblastus fucicola]|uniref:Tyrosine-protein kinase wzc n=1 Tax=Mariniblastus fucicola TaxID=980251 RepID=A0A5B9PLJ3_9BACT|nr:AAA family ATPase [Mariniblastus fucicola]QEG23541.1 Tyrosine-protein kinase wzc [Mariniblastus fucicola]